MNEKSSKRREWVKNAAIIFLTVMLLLTFFSNTIMNYSLPQVATSYVQPGTITAKVRGTGNVEATDPYNVVVKESRVISSVAVKQGDEVEKDAVLYYLEDTESEELKKAEAELDAMVLAYMLKLFSGETSVDIINKVESGNTDSFNTYKAKIADMQNRVLAAEGSVTTNQNNVDNLNKQLLLLKNSSTADITAEENAVKEAEGSLASAENAVNNAKAKITELESKKKAIEALIQESIALVPSIDADTLGPTGGIQTLQDKVAQAAGTLNTVGDNLKDAVNTALGLSDDNKLSLEQAIAEANSKAILNNKYQNQEDPYHTAVSTYNDHLYIYNIAIAAHEVAKAELDSASAVLQNYNSYLSQLASVENQLASAKSELSSANSGVSSANSTISTAEQILANKKENKSNEQAQTDIQKQLIEAEAALASAKTALDKLKSEQTDLIVDLQSELNLENQNTQITDKKAEIAKLKAESMGSLITAPVAGTVTNMARVAGESTKPEEVVAVIQAAGKGFTLSFSVTNDQAKKVQVGDNAELQNSWYYNEMKIILTAIRPDPENPGQKKLLTFSVTGDVQAGQALNLSVGQRNENYELVVPNSAVREDNNGKFILIVESKSSPLGNRYFATRVDVEVLASDDMNTAISAGLYGYEYVITTATKPVEAGKQVRLND